MKSTSADRQNCASRHEAIHLAVRRCSHPRPITWFSRHDDMSTGDVWRGGHFTWPMAGWRAVVTSLSAALVPQIWKCGVLDLQFCGIKP